MASNRGKLLRLIPDPSAPGGHAPAPDNPLLEDANTEPDVYAGRYVDEDPDSEPTGSRVIWIAGPFTALPAEAPYGGALDGRFLLGDRFAGWVEALRFDESGVVVHDDHVGHSELATAWAQGPDGYLYAARFGDYKGHSDDARARIYRAQRRADAP